ncbi:MAG: hypothetical protein RL494_803, partial [Bacteroidota bacterium]
EFYKEKLKLEIEKLKIYAALFAGLITVIGSITLKESFTPVNLIVLSLSATFAVAMSLVLVNSFVNTNTLVNLLKKK